MPFVGDFLWMEDKGMNSETSAHCWNCRADLAAKSLRCAACSKIQSIKGNSDFFACLGLGRYLQVDLQELERRFHQLSRQFHPDFHQASDPAEQAISLENSARINQAYGTLKDPISRVMHLIRLEQGPGTEIPVRAPQALLEEVITLQEMLDEYRSAVHDPEQHALRAQVEEALEKQQNHLRAEEKQLSQCGERWDQCLRKGDASAGSESRETLLEEMQKILSCRSYFKNLIGDIQHVLDGNADRREVRH